MRKPVRRGARVNRCDVNELNPVDGDPAVNALGERRGLLAFKIVVIGADPDGGGSVLPNIIIEVCPPVIPTGTGGVAGGTGWGVVPPWERVRLVQ